MREKSEQRRKKSLGLVLLMFWLGYFRCPLWVIGEENVRGRDIDTETLNSILHIISQGK